MKKNYYILLLFLTVALVAYFVGNHLPSKNIQPVEVRRAVKKHKKTVPHLKLPRLEMTMPNKADLDPVTRGIIDLESNLSYVERSKLVWKLRQRTLRQEDFRAIYTFLKTNPQEGGAQLFWHSLKNDLLVFVIDDGRYKESTGQLMVDIINDSEQHEVMREYTLQYVSDFFERHWLTRKSFGKELDDLSSVDKQLQEVFLTTMWNQTSSHEGPIAGTSLIRLNDLSKRFSAIDQNRIEREVERMINDSMFPVSSRMAALSISAERKLYHLRSAATQIALDETLSASLRMSALHTATTMDPDEDFIDEITEKFINNQSADKRLKMAAKMALEKLKKTRG